jgi:hypothetical protein
VHGLVFIFCAPLLIFGGTENTGSYFNVMRSLTHFGRYRGRQVQFLCFVLSDSFWDVPRASGSIFMFCATKLIFGGTEGLGSRFHVLCSRTHFKRYRGSRVLFLWFALVGLFWGILIACCAAPCSAVLAPFDTRGDSYFTNLKGPPVNPTAVGRVAACRSCAAQQTIAILFWAIPRASGPIFMLCRAADLFSAVPSVSGLVLLFLLSRTHSRRY